MLEIDLIYKSALCSATLIRSSYATNYSEKDYNPLPAISFPVKAAYKYKSGNFESIVHSNSILFEAQSGEFIVTKFSEFCQDITLSFQFHGDTFEVIKKFTSNNQVDQFIRTPQIEFLIQSFLKRSGKNNKLLLDQIVDDLFFQELSKIPASTLRIKNIKPWISLKIDSAKDYIHNYCSNDISISDIAIACNLSPFHFSRVFKKTTGCSPYEYVMKVRIAKAKQLLGNNYSVTSSAYKAGFNSIENFSYGFKRMVGVSPTQYQKSKISKVL